VDPSSKIFTKLVNKNAIKPEKGVPYPHKFGRNLPSGPSLWIFKPCASMLIVKLPVRVIERVL
jgi:hypothetical protein